MKFTRIIYTMLVMIAGYSLYYLYGVKDVNVIQISPNLELPVLSGQNVDNVNYDELGTKSYRITASFLDHYAQSGDTKFEYPVLYVYKEGSTLEWQITADRGIVDKNHILTLFDNVLAKNLLPDAGFSTMATKKLQIQLDNRDFWADEQVVLVGPAFETTGQAMKGNFAENIATLYNQVQGRYETLTP